MPDLFHQSTVLITGASSGLGTEYAWQLAPWVGRLILVARREDRLRELAQKIQQAHTTIQEVLVYPCDLTQESERLALLARVGSQVDLLINNAGLGDYGDVATADWARLRMMMDLNVTALVHLTHGVLPGMRQRGRGGIIMVSSLASELPIPDFALYAATKACVSRFAEGLRLEVKEDGIRVCTVCPGPIHTEFGQVARRSEKKKSNFPFYDAMYTSPRRVVRESLRTLEHGDALTYANPKIALLGMAIRLIPRPLLRLFLGRRWRKVGS